MEKKFGFFYQPDYNYIRRKKTEEKKAAAYKWSALADEGGQAAAPWTCDAWPIKTHGRTMVCPARGGSVESVPCLCREQYLLS